MSVAHERWEVGSLFHWADYEAGAAVSPPWSGGSLVGCGRDALRVVAQLGLYRRWWVPSYLCQEVVQAICELGLDVRVYSDSPLERKLDLSDLGAASNDAIVVVNYFGLRTASDVVISKGAAVIEDHTHAPTSRWARESTADFCIASLRKLFPLVDGGAVWSPKRHAIPVTERVTPSLESGALQKLTGMLLKQRYLEGHDVSKPVFRSFLESGEQRLYGPDTSAMTPLSRTMLATFPFERWEARQRSNMEALLQGTPPGQGFRVLRPDSKDACPFSAFFVFDDEAECERVRNALIERRVYPSRLWPLDSPVLPGIPDEHVSLARRSFSIPTDMRYRTGDMHRVAAALRDALGAEGC